MNITDLIVDFIKEGNVVEFPGMGTLTSSNVSAYHDTASGTYYPARRTVVMNNTQSGNQAIIRQIADKECVSVEIAEQMWINFVGALDDKLQRNPAGHEFPGIGTMRRAGGKVAFVAIEGLDLDADKHHEQPLENISTYIPKNVEDPFAAFEKPAPAPAPAPEPAPAPVVEPAPAPAPEPVKSPEPVVEPKIEVVEPKPEVKEEAPAAAPAPAPEAKPAFNPEEVVATAAAAAAAATVASAASNADHLSQVKKMLDEIPSSPKDAKEQKRAEKAAAKAEKEARKAAEEAEKAAAKQAAKAAKEKDALAREAEKAAKAAAKEREKAEKKAHDIVSVPGSGIETKPEEEKKKKHTGLWIVIILLLLALAGGGYYYFVKGGSVSMGESCAQDVAWNKYDVADADMRNMLEFTDANISRSTNDVHNYLAEYIKNYLLARHYSNAYALVMNQVDQYANDRLHELMVPGYSHKRFHQYDDNWLTRNMADYRAWGGRYYQFKVQEELMNVDLLDEILDNLIAQLGLHADGFGLVGGNVANTAKAAPKNDKPYVETVPEAPTFRNSKQGFDIVAGFFTSKVSANKCANQLKALGSDAYIISKAGGYYVSMGSAPTRTAAEAMEKHIKSWYKSDVKIYNFNE